MNKTTKIFLMFNLIWSSFQGDCNSAEDCRVKDLYHHRSSTACLGRCPKLTEEELNHLIDCHLRENLKFIDFSCQKKLNDIHLQKISDSPMFSTIIKLDLCKTSVTYDGIAYLWRSLTLGSKRNDDPIYDCYYNQPISIVKVEIGHTPALERYKELLNEEKEIFPLPLRKSFQINFEYQGKEDGFKEIVLLDHGKKIEKQLIQ